MQYTQQGEMHTNFQKVQPNSMTSVFIGDLDETTNEHEVSQYFSQFGLVTSVIIRKDPLTQKSRGFGYVVFDSAISVDNAVNHSQGNLLKGRQVRVMQYKNPKELDQEANIFVQDLKETVTQKDLKSFFSQFGNILSTKIAIDNNRNSLGYGYIQFEKKKDAEECLKQSSYQFQGNEIVVSKFVPKYQRENTSKQSENKNLYVKNLPQKDQTELENDLRELFQKHGKLNSLSVKLDENTKNYFAFVCYENQEDAEKALKTLQDANPFKTEKPMYLNFLQNKDTRFIETSESNIYTKNLKSDVTKEILEHEFSRFGQILSIKIKQPTVTQQNQQNQPTTQFAFINFSKTDESLLAIQDCNKYDSIKALYVGESPYIGPFLSKKNRETFLKSKPVKSQQPSESMYQPQQQLMYPQQMYPMMQMMPMMFPMYPQYNQYGGYRQQRPYNNYNRQYQNPNYRMGGRKPFMNNNRQGQDNSQDQNNYQQRPMQQKNPNWVPRQQNGNYQAKNNNFKQGIQGQQGQQPQTRQPETNQSNPISNLTQEQRDSWIQQLEKNGSTQEGRQQNWTYLGNLIFPMIQKMAPQEQVGKITGMLLDFDVFTYTEIIAMLVEKDKLKEQVEEAMKTIAQNQDQAQ